MSDYDDFAANDLADLRKEFGRPVRYRPHWCDECHGRTGRGSPCYEEPQEEPAYAE